MTKEEYFDSKHLELANQFGVREKTINFLRTFAVGRKMSRGQIILWLRAQIKKTRQFKSCPHCKGKGKLLGDINPKIEHKEALELLERANERDWKDITFEYKFIEK